MMPTTPSRPRNTLVALERTTILLSTALLLLLSGNLCSEYSLKAFGKRVQNALVAAGPKFHYHNNVTAAQTLPANSQLLIDQYGTKETGSILRFFNWLNANSGGGGAGTTPARMWVKERVHWEMFNTGASIVYVKMNVWVCREDIFNIAGQTDTVPSMITHGQSLVPQNAAVAGSINFSPSEPGYNLFYNPYWCRHWKAIKSYNIKLLPGEKFSHTFRARYVYDQKETELSGAAKVSYVKGALRIAGYAFGQPAFDANAGAAPTNIGSAGGGLVGYVFQDAELGWQAMGNSMFAQSPTAFNMATAGHVWQPIASNEATVTLF